MFSFKFALLALTAGYVATANGADNRLLQDFDWDIIPEDGWPQINFDDANENSEVIFKYNYTGTIVDGVKYFGFSLREPDCITEISDGTTGSILLNDLYAGDELTLNVDIVQETIVGSDYYNAVNNTAASIDFCLRIDYFSGSDSINFHETNVTIGVDLTAGFTLDNILTDRDAALNADADAELDYPVIAYICDNANLEIANPPALTQGSVLQFCVAMNETVTAAIYVDDILNFELTQTGTTPSNPITNTQPDPLTAKLCREDGICNIRTQLASKWFAETDPAPLAVSGTAILAFGVASAMPSAAPSAAPTATPARRLRVPITGMLSQEDVRKLMEQQQAMEAASRQLQEGGPESPFDLDVAVIADDQEVEGTAPEAKNNTAVIAGVVVAVIVVASVLAWYFCIYKKKQQQKANEMKQSNMVVSSYKDNNLPVTNGQAQQYD